MSAPHRIAAVAKEQRAAITSAILHDLPDWFGQPAALQRYAATAQDRETLAAYDGAGQAIGFLSLQRHGPEAAEAHVLGVLRAWHRRGIGKALFAAAAQGLRADGVRYLTVKTLAARHPDPHYAATRRFYEAIGFRPLMDLPELWGEDNPCLLMLMDMADTSCCTL